MSLKWMCLTDDGIVTVLPPITSLADFHKAQWELGSVFFHANPVLRPEESKIYFRGDHFGRHLGGDRKTSTQSLLATFEKYRCKCAAKDEVPWYTYVRMRHSGVRNTALLDWTASPEIALWFAIHEDDGSLKKFKTGVLWAFKYKDEDEEFPENEDNPIPSNGGTKSVVCLSNNEVMHCFCEGDGDWGERPTMQRAAVVRLRLLEPDKNGMQVLLPMDKDPQFRGRLIKIDVEGNYEFINAELNLWLEQEIFSREIRFRRYLGLDNRRNERDYDVVQKLNANYEKEFMK